jgi:hypothetical protein
MQDRHDLALDAERHARALALGHVGWKQAYLGGHWWSPSMLGVSATAIERSAGRRVDGASSR